MAIISFLKNLFGFSQKAVETVSDTRSDAYFALIVDGSEIGMDKHYPMISLGGMNYLRGRVLAPGQVRNVTFRDGVQMDVSYVVEDCWTGEDGSSQICSGLYALYVDAVRETGKMYNTYA